MALNFIEDPKRKPTAWQSVGAGINTGLKSLLDAKIADKQRQPVVNSLLGMGIDQNSADYISRQPADIQQKLLSDYSAPMQQQYGMPQNQQQGYQQQLSQYPQINGGQYQQGQAQGARGGFGGQRKLKQQLAEQAAANKQSANDIKESYSWFKDTKKSGKAATQGDIRLKRMEKLINEGSLPYAAFYNGIQSLSRGEIGEKIPLVGGIVSAIEKSIGMVGRAVQTGITARDTEEFEKLSADFVKDAKAIFGARLTDTDLKAFMATVPTLAQTDNGKKQLIRNIRAFNDLVHVQEQAADQIIRANNGKIPANLQILVEDMTGEYLDEIAQNIINGPTNSFF